MSAFTNDIPKLDAVAQQGVEFTEWRTQNTVVLPDIGLPFIATSTRYLDLLRNTNKTRVKVTGLKLHGNIFGGYRPPGLKMTIPVGASNQVDVVPMFYPVIVGFALFVVSQNDFGKYNEYGKINFENAPLPLDSGDASVLTKPKQMYAYKVFGLSGFEHHETILIGWLNSFIKLVMETGDVLILAYRATDNWTGGGMQLDQYDASALPSNVMHNTDGLGHGSVLLEAPMLVPNAVKAWFAGTFSYKLEEVLPDEEPEDSTI